MPAVSRRRAFLEDTLSDATLTLPVESADRTLVPAAARYVLKAGAFVALLWAASRLGDSVGALGAAFLFLLVAAPILAVSAYRSALRRIHFLSAVSSTGRIAGLLSGPYLRILLALPLALWSAASLVVGAELRPAQLWGGVVLLAVLVGLCFALVSPTVSREVRPWFRFIPASRIAVTLAVAVAVTSLLLLHAGAERVSFSSLAEAIAAQPDYVGSSHLMATLFEVMAIFHGLGGDAHGAAGEGVGAGAALLLTAGLFVTLFGLAQAFAAFVVPAREYARILAPPEPTETPRTPSPGRIAIAAALLTFLVGFIYFPGIAYLERALTPAEPATAGAPPTVAEPVARAREVMEQIDEIFVRAGTIERVEALRAEYLGRIALRQTTLEPLARDGFAAMRANVPAYLDAYYGLPAEYARLGQLLIGDFETYVASELRAYLERNAPFAAFETDLAAVAAYTAASVAEYAEAASRLVAENEVAGIDGFPPEIAATATAAELLGAFHFDDAIAFPTRVGGGLAAGAVTASAIVVAKAITKLTAKGTVQLAAAALAKLAGGKLAAGGAGTVAGAFIGGAIGSLVPGAGTAAGAVIGGAAGGILMGVGVDYLLLKLEEELSREQFQAEIVAAIDEAETEFMASLSGEPALPLEPLAPTPVELPAP